MFNFIKLSSWGLLFSEASYYGYRFGVVVGPLMVLAFPIRAQKGER